MLQDLIDGLKLSTFITIPDVSKNKQDIFPPNNKTISNVSLKIKSYDGLSCMMFLLCGVFIIFTIIVIITIESYKEEEYNKVETLEQHEKNYLNRLDRPHDQESETPINIQRSVRRYNYDLYDEQVDNEGADYNEEDGIIEEEEKNEDEYIEYDDYGNPIEPEY